MTADEKKLITRLLRSITELNENLQLIGKTQTTSVPNESNLPEWINAHQAQSILQRGRTWLNGRMLEAANHPMNTNWFLIRGLDYTYEGNRLAFRKESVLRLKAEMRRMGATEACVI